MCNTFYDWNDFELSPYGVVKRDLDVYKRQHTIGHGIEASSSLYHGEAVALGMLPLCGATISPRVIAVRQKCARYRTIPYDWDKIAAAAFHDKKADGDTVCVTMVDEIGSFRFAAMPCAEVIAAAKKCLEELDA